MIKKLFFIITCMCYSAGILAATFIEVDFEGGKIPYVGSKNRHPGGGYISFLGGETRKGINPGDGSQYYGEYTNVVLDNSSAAKNSVKGSNYALKTHYKVGSERSFQKNTTIIRFPETFNVYVRWYQKWSKSWKWPSDQQKFIKIKGPGSSQNFAFTAGHDYINLTKKTPPPKSVLNQTYVYSDWRKSDTLFRRDDSLPNNSNFKFDTNRWYCIEVMVKSSTMKDSKGEYALWVNDDLKLNLKNTFNYVKGGDSKHPKYAGVDRVEMQHVMQLTGGRRTTVDMPTWMDNIVISDQRIGCSGVPPAPPLTLSLPDAPQLSIE